MERIVKAAFDAADLVDGKEHITALENVTAAWRDERTGLIKERDEARNEAEDLKAQVSHHIGIAIEEADLSETQGRQLAALREACDKYTSVSDFGGPEWRALGKVMGDTAAAAAQYQLVKEGYVVVPYSAAHGAVKLGRDFYKDCGTSPCLYPDWLRELGVFVDNALAAAPSSVAEGEAGEGEGE